MADLLLIRTACTIFDFEIIVAETACIPGRILRLQFKISPLRVASSSMRHGFHGEIRGLRGLEPPKYFYLCISLVILVSLLWHFQMHKTAR